MTDVGTDDGHKGKAACVISSVTRLVTNHQRAERGRSTTHGKEDESDSQNSDDKQPGFDEISEVVDNDTIYRDGGRFLMIHKSLDLIHSKDTNRR